VRREDAAKSSAETRLAGCIDENGGKGKAIAAARKILSAAGIIAILLDKTIL
jgi:hypothetical protein